MCILNDGPEVFSSYASCKLRIEITVWMPWPLNHDMGGGGGGVELVWPSNHFRLWYGTLHMFNTYRSTGNVNSTAYTRTQPASFLRSRTQNANSVTRVYTAWFKYRNYFSRVYTLRNSKCSFQIKIQNTHFAIVWKQSRPLQLLRFKIQAHKWWRDEEPSTWLSEFLLGQYI